MRLIPERLVAQKVILTQKRIHIFLILKEEQEEFVELAKKYGKGSMTPTYDNSMLAQFKSCPESYRLKYRYEKDASTGLYVGLAKPDAVKEDHHRDWGSAVHAGLKVFYLKGGWDDIVKAFKAEYPKQLDEGDKAKTTDNGLLLLDRYIKRYSAQDAHWEIVDVEVRQEFEIYPGVRFTVKMDLVIRQQGCLYFVDHKTTKMDAGIDAGYWTQFEPNSALTGYTGFCLEKYGECSGGIINALGVGFRTKSELFDPEDTVKGWEVYDKQELKYSKYHGKDMMYGSGFKSDFQRNVFSRSPQQVAAWKEDSLRWIDKMKAEEFAFQEGGKVIPEGLPGSTSQRTPIAQWTKNEGNCRFCNFKDICIAVGDTQIIDSMYVKVNPLEYLEQ